MAEKKKYTRPTVFKVKLNPEQAVLGTCSSKSINGGDAYAQGHCQDGSCKAAHGGGGADSGAIS